MLGDGKTIPEAAKELGISEQTFQLRAFRDREPRALARPSPRRPASDRAHRGHGDSRSPRFVADGPARTAALPSPRAVAMIDKNRGASAAVGHDAQVEFSSEGLDVTPECQGWFRISATGGMLWTYQASQTAANDTQVCHLQDPQGNVAAGHPVPAGEPGPPHGRLTEPRVRTPTGLPRSRTHEQRPGWRPLSPGTTVLTPTEATSGPASAASQPPVNASRHTSHRRGSRLTRQRGFTLVLLHSRLTAPPKARDQPRARSTHGRDRFRCARGRASRARARAVVRGGNGAAFRTRPARARARRGNQAQAGVRPQAARRLPDRADAPETRHRGDRQMPPSALGLLADSELLARAEELSAFERERAADSQRFDVLAAALTIQIPALAIELSELTQAAIDVGTGRRLTPVPERALARSPPTGPRSAAVPPGSATGGCARRSTARSRSPTAIGAPCGSCTSSRSAPPSSAGARPRSPGRGRVRRCVRRARTRGELRVRLTRAANPNRSPTAIRTPHR